MAKNWYVYSMKNETGYDAGVFGIGEYENIISKIEIIESILECKMHTLNMCKSEKEARAIRDDWNTTWTNNNQRMKKGGE